MRIKRLTEQHVIRLTPKFKRRLDESANDLSMPPAVLTRLALKAGLIVLKRKFHGMNAEASPEQ